MAIVQISKIKVRRGQEKTTGMPQLDAGEFGWAEDTEHLYIGKRIAEGANSDENSRILTDRDLNNLFGLLGNVGAASTTTIYKYKWYDDAINPYSQNRNILDKLDDSVSLKDFIDLGASDRDNLQKAITQIFANASKDERRVLKIPAGTYNIASTVTLPPYTTLVGEGPDVTTLIFGATQGYPSPLFETVDTNNQAFPMSGITANTQPKNIHIEGMTLRYHDGINFTSAPLLSLDNVNRAEIVDINFGNSSATGLISTGTAIQIRGNSVLDMNLAFSNNIMIDRCRFIGLGTAIHQNTGTTNKFTIQDSEFNYIGNRAIEMWGAVAGGYYGPQYGTIQNNTFKTVSKEVVYIGTPTTTSTSYITSLNNTFEDGNKTRQKPFVVFNDAGNSSANDYWRIFDVYNTSTSQTISYFPALVGGNCRVDMGYSRTSVIGPKDVYTTAIRIPITGNQQMAVITYELSNPNMSRAGTLTMNTSPNSDGTWYSSVSDYYNYSEVDANSSLNLTFSTDFTVATTTNFVSLTCLNQQDSTSLAVSTATVFEYQITLIV
jgi:hypothetical protein